MIIDHNIESAIPRQRDFRLFADVTETTESRPCPVCRELGILSHNQSSYREWWCGACSVHWREARTAAPKGGGR